LDTERFSVVLERIAESGEKDLDMREKALLQEKQLAIQKRIRVASRGVDGGGVLGR
jgi:hypothetical protein